MSQPEEENPLENDAHGPGTTLASSRYSILEKLGAGGQGTTYTGIDKSNGTRVTIKRFRVRGASSWKQVELAEREAKVLAHVHHPNLPSYVDHFEEGGNLYLVTEHIEGQTVAALRSKGPIEEGDVIRFLHDAASALGYLHSRTPPLVHRDIKPSNVLVRRDGSFAIIDFGAVRDRLKVTGSTVVGTFGYMAPEQFQGRAMPASDVYAAGTTAIAMLTGIEPEDLPHKGLAIDVKAALGRKARPELVNALTRMVEPDPDKRSQNLIDLLSDLPMSQGGKRPEAPSTERPPQAPKETFRSSNEAEETRREFEQVVAEAGDQVARVAEELGQQIRRVAAQVADGDLSFKELKKEAKRVGQEARRQAQEAAEEARRNAKRTARENRKERRDERQETRRDSRNRMQGLVPQKRGRGDRPAAPLGGPVLLVVLLALSIAQFAVLIGLRVVVPVVLYAVSLLFFGSVPGAAMRNAARHVSEAGKRAITAIGTAKARVSGRAPVDPHANTAVSAVGDVDPHASTEVGVVGSPSAPTPKARVIDAETGTKRRIAGDTLEGDALAEEEAEAEARVGARPKDKQRTS